MSINDIHDELVANLSSAMDMGKFLGVFNTLIGVIRDQQNKIDDLNARSESLAALVEKNLNRKPVVKTIIQQVVGSNPEVVDATPAISEEEVSEEDQPEPDYKPEPEPESESEQRSNVPNSLLVRLEGKIDALEEKLNDTLLELHGLGEDKSILDRDGMAPEFLSNSFKEPLHSTSLSGKLFLSSDPPIDEVDDPHAGFTSRRNSKLISNSNSRVPSASSRAPSKAPSRRPSVDGKASVETAVEIIEGDDMIEEASQENTNENLDEDHTLGFEETDPPDDDDDVIKASGVEDGVEEEGEVENGESVPVPVGSLPASRVASRIQSKRSSPVPGELQNETGSSEENAPKDSQDQEEAELVELQATVLSQPASARHSKTPTPVLKDTGRTPSPAVVLSSAGTPVRKTVTLVAPQDSAQNSPVPAGLSADSFDTSSTDPDKLAPHAMAKQVQMKIRKDMPKGLLQVTPLAMRPTTMQSHSFSTKMKTDNFLFPALNEKITPKSAQVAKALWKASLAAGNDPRLIQQYPHLHRRIIPHYHKYHMDSQLPHARLVALAEYRAIRSRDHKDMIDAKKFKHLTEEKRHRLVDLLRQKGRFIRISRDLVEGNTAFV